MQRSIDEVRSEIDRRKAEYERKKRARIRSIGIGSAAALALMLAAIPVIKAVLDTAAGTQPPSSYQSVIDSADGKSGSQEGSGAANESYVPQVGGNAPDAVGIPHAEEPTLLPESAPFGQGNGDGVQNEGTMIEWFNAERMEYFSVERSALKPERASIVLADASEKREAVIRDAAVTARLTEGLYMLLDHASGADDATGGTLYNIKLIKDNDCIGVSVFDNGSFFVGSKLFEADERSIEGFNAIVYAAFEEFFERG